MTTTRIGLTEVEAAQSQKHVAVNEALNKLDFFAAPYVVSASTTAQPGSPSDGDAYILPATHTGTAWASMTTGSIAHYHDGAWYEYLAKAGYMAYVADTGTQMVYTTSWVGMSAQNMVLLGVNTAADSTNKLSVASEAVLFTNVGNGVQTKLNKAASGDTASFLFQTNWVGYAEIGLCGDNNFAFKTYDGSSTWYTGLTLVSGAKGVPKLPSFTTANLPSASTAGAGAMAYDTTLSKLVVSNGSSWVAQT